MAKPLEKFKVYLLCSKCLLCSLDEPLRGVECVDIARIASLKLRCKSLNRKKRKKERKKGGKGNSMQMTQHYFLGGLGGGSSIFFIFFFPKGGE